MADEESPLDIAISRLQQKLPVIVSETPAYTREEEDDERLQRLSVTNTSGDTLVIVRFPPGDFVDCTGCKWDTKAFLMESEQLLATGSSVFAERLSPKAQAQTRRHLNDYYKQYKYVLDLTPQIEGDESASEVAQLSLSNGVIDWWKSHYFSNVSKYLVYGHDDNCPHHCAEIISEDKVWEKVRIMGDPIDIGQLEYPKLRKILDYCPIRHRAAILRLLMAIRHGDLILNSAPRLATMAVIAKQFDCVEVVKDPVLTWFMAEPNHNFIDINAEDALKIAWMLELSDIARVAFQVLVVERVIEMTSGAEARMINNKQQCSLFGRPRGSVTDEQETCIQHAAQKLRQRAEDVWDQLMSDDVNTYLGINQWPKDDPDLCKDLRDWIHQVVLDATAVKDIAGHNGMMEDHDRNRARYVSVAERVSTRYIYLTLQPAQRILTTYFWRMFSEYSCTRLASIDDYRLNRLVFSMEFASAVSNLRNTWDPRKLDVNIERTGPLVFGLSDDEFKFLPLWAGGLDDGTGGVYQSEIPDAERGVPIGPGPGFYTGETIPDDATSIDDDATTIYTGTGTVTMTEGYSVQAARSQTIGPSHQGAEDATLAITTAGLSLTPVQPPTTTSNAEEDTATPTTQTHFDIDGDFDWMSDGSEHENLSDLGGSDFDSDDNNNDTNDAEDSENAHSGETTNPTNTNSGSGDHQSST
ncbi:hypothetical protein F5Y12DRAFT_576197 [Xylaria sp. FL1777]|nr:hypothetical protein F5Y12DRAFT_576197 [Xylaria sp. FL1777]